jgi:hypothetical protein
MTLVTLTASSLSSTVLAASATGDGAVMIAVFSRFDAENVPEPKQQIDPTLFKQRSQ